MKIAFLTSIYPAHAEKIYKENPSLKNKSSDEQMEFIRWHALSSYVRWFELLEEKGYQTCSFNHNLPHVEHAWAKENQFQTKTSNPIMEIGKEKITQFKPDIIFCFAPPTYLSNNFLYELATSLEKKPKLIAWYGANAGNENIFSFFDLTLSNSKHLVNCLNDKGIKADFLQHSFDPFILKRIKIPRKRKSRIAFFGNLNYSTADFKNRTKFLEQISIKTGKVDVFGQISKISSSSRLKYQALSARNVISDKLSKVIKSTKIDYWSDRKNLPSNAQVVSAKFASSVRSPRYGKAMFELLASYDTALNYHNLHTGNNACNMRLFETTGLGCALLTDAKDDLSEYFEVGKEILTYDSFLDLVAKVKYLQNNPSEVKKLGENAQRRTLECHNTDIQISRFIKILKKNFSE